MLKKSNVKQGNRDSLAGNELPADMLSQVSGGISTGIVILPPLFPTGSCPNPDLKPQP